MALTNVTTEGTQIIPGAVASWRTAAENSGLSTNGVLMLIGEADAGPDYTLEADLGANIFGADSLADVVAKYKSGNLVDAFRVAVTPANDNDIKGAPGGILICKTNKSVRSTALLGSYGTLADQGMSKIGDTIAFQVTAKATEVGPSTGPFTWINNTGTTNFGIRVSGGAVQTVALTANSLPIDVVNAVNGLSGVVATGGDLVVTLPGTGDNIAVAAPGANVIVITFSGADFTHLPTRGQTLVIPMGSAIAGAADANVGAYEVTSATAKTVTATKLSNAGKLTNPATPITAPVIVGATPVVATTDFAIYNTVTIKVTSAVSDGLGKTLEICQLTTGTDLLERSCYMSTTLVMTQVVAGSQWISRTGDAHMLASSAEYVADLACSQYSSNVTEEISAGGEIALKIGYTGDTATVVVTDASITLTRTGGAGADIGLVYFKDRPTLNDLAALINSKTGWSCSVGTGILGQLPSAALDNNTYPAGTTYGVQTCRIKIDAYRFFRAVSSQSVLVRLQTTATGVVEQAGAGLPVPTAAIAFLAGGSKGGTYQTAAEVSATSPSFEGGLVALETVNGNFLIPLFSRNATDDKTDGLTESTSTYSIDTINAACRTHVLKCSTLKRRRNRQAVLSYRDTFVNSKTAGANTATFRCNMTFQDLRVLGGQFQPWMTAVDAAAMQAAGFYRAIVGKFANIQGAVQAAGDFNDQNTDHMESALLAGLLPLRKSDEGGWEWVSDQTTYGRDSNFCYNSLQAVYIADIVALTTAKRMERAFKGQNPSDVSAAVALAFLDRVMEDMRKLKLICTSDDAILGYKNAVIKISGPAMVVSLEIKLNTAIYFIPISFLVSPVQQTA